MNLSDIISIFARYIHRVNDIDIVQNCGLAEGTAAATIKTTSDIVYNLYNKQITKSATDNIAMTPCLAQAISATCYYLVSADALGAIIITKGTNNVFALPVTPSGMVAIGAILIVTDETHTFTSGTTDLSATGITASFYDIDTGIAAYLINQAQKRVERGVTIIRNGHQFTIMDFDYMTVRANIVISQGDLTVTLPFPGYKDFQDGGLTITDPSSITYQMEKCDVVPLGAVFQARPAFISRLPAIETVFTPDGTPAKIFNIWPKADQTYVLDVIAYQYSPDLDGVLYTSNWLTNNASDMLLFGALVEYASFFPGEARAEVWKERWQEAVWTLYSSQEKEKYSGSPIFTKYPNLLRVKDSNLGIASNKAGIMSYGY